MIFDQKWIKYISYKRVSEDKTRWVRCTSIHIEYWNTVFASYNISVPVVVEWNSFCWCGRHKNNNMGFDQKWIQNISYKRDLEDNTRWFRCTTIHIEYKNIVFASYNFSVPVFAEWNSFCWCGRHKNNNMIFDQNEQQNISIEKVAEDNTRYNELGALASA